MRITDDQIEQAARRTAINLMRLTEGVEHREADEVYSTQYNGHGLTEREARHHVLRQHYRKWFGDHARIR